MADRNFGKIDDSSGRPRLIGIDQHRLMENPVTRRMPDGSDFTIAKIRQLTGISAVEPLEDDLIDGSDLTVIECDEEEGADDLFPGHILFYKGGKLPVFGGDGEDFCRLLKSRPVTVVLHIDKGSEIPDCWVSALKGLRERYSIFSFVRLQDLNQGFSRAMIYIDGKLQNEGGALSHSKQICLSEDALIGLIEPIILEHLLELNKSRKEVAANVGNVMKQSPRVKIHLPTPEKKEETAIEKERRMERFEMEWAKRFQQPPKY
jgi:hypothetical protein